jgi:hypothetical protein
METSIDFSKYDIVISVSKKYYTQTPADEAYGLNFVNSSLTVIGFDSNKEYEDYIEQESVASGESEGTYVFDYNVIKNICRYVEGC